MQVSMKNKRDTIVTTVKKPQPVIISNVKDVTKLNNVLKENQLMKHKAGLLNNEDIKAELIQQFQGARSDKIKKYEMETH